MANVSVRMFPSGHGLVLVCLRVFHISDIAILSHNGDKTRTICKPISLFPFQRFQWCHLL